MNKNDYRFYLRNDRKIIFLLKNITRVNYSENDWNKKSNE